MTSKLKTRYLTGTKENNTHSTFILLNAGAGRRTKNYGNKFLIKYQNKKIIDHQIDAIKKTYSHDVDIIVVAGFMALNLLQKLGNIRIIENIQYETLNIAESMRLAVNASLKGDVFFIHGDLFFTPSFIIPPDKHHIYIPVDKKNRMQKDEVGVIVEETLGDVKNFAYGLPIKWCQISFFPSTSFEILKTALNNVDKNLNSFEVLNYLMEKPYHMDIRYFESPKGKIKEIDSIRDTK